jgi:glycosyltransferase involved in cell wall biosynthesis
MIVDVILPCLNEAPALPWFLGRMPSGFQPIVVDNGSTDGPGHACLVFHCYARCPDIAATLSERAARGW